MLQPFLNQLSKKRIILGSSSPRRQEILRLVGLPFEVIPSTFEENLDIKNFPSVIEFVIETAKQKALDVAESLKKNNSCADLVICADTIVVLESNLFGKPKTQPAAVAMLERLSGKTHKVYTGVALIFPKSQTKGNESPMALFHEETEVTMGTLTREVIEAYVATGEPLDKAGAYAIQGIGGSLVKGISGDYYNVVGFPLHKFCTELSSFWYKGALKNTDS